MSATTTAHLTLRTALSDAFLLTRRNLVRLVRIPSLMVFSTIQPVMLVLLFGYVFGGAIDVPGVEYIDYLLPGILVQAILFGSMQTGIALADDLSRGMVDRFRSLPMARSAVLVGRTVSDTVRNVFVVVLMILVGMLIGFRFHAGFWPALGAVVLIVSFGFAVSWMSALVGLVVKDVESVQAASFIWIFPLVFASSVFVPPETMPRWLEAVAEANPVTKIVDAARALTLGGATASDLWPAVGWIAVIVAVFLPLAVARYRRTTM